MNILNILDVIQGMTPHELADACTHERASVKNMFAEELCRRAGLWEKYRETRTDAAAKEIIKQAAKSFNLLMI